MNKLFEETAIKSLVLSNRSIRSATWSAVCDQKGYVTDRAIGFYAKLAGGGIGLIITGCQYVMTNSVAMPYQMGNYNETILEGLRRLAETIHLKGGKVMAQLGHTGSKANPELFLDVR